MRAVNVHGPLSALALLQCCCLLGEWKELQDEVDARLGGPSALEALWDGAYRQVGMSRATPAASRWRPCRCLLRVTCWHALRRVGTYLATPSIALRLTFSRGFCSQEKPRWRSANEVTHPGTLLSCLFFFLSFFDRP